MTKQPVDEEVLENYLLGASSETETERLDDLSITDDEVASRLRAIENDLVDAYVRGELSEERLSGFTSHYLASPMRREKVAFSKTFLALADKAATARAEDIQRIAPESKRHLGKPRWLSLFAVPNPALLWGLTAAALVFLFAGGYLVLENVRLRDQMAQTRADRAALEQREHESQRQLDEQRSTDAETEKELERVRERLGQLEQEAANEQRAKTEPVEPTARVVAFALAPPARGTGQPPAVTVPVGTDFVSLTLQLESDDFPAYRVALKDSTTDRVVWRSGRLKALSKGGSRSLPIRLRADLLKPQRYTLEVSGVRTTGVAEIISSYSFKVGTQ